MNVKRTLEEYETRRRMMVGEIIRLARKVTDPLNREAERDMNYLRKSIDYLDKMETPEQTLLKELRDLSE